MTIVFFWIKIAFKRIINLFKTSPVTIILALAFIAAFVYAFVNNYIAIQLDFQLSVLISLFLAIYSLFSSLKNYHVLPYLIKYSKSKYQNKIIHFRYFMKQAFKNNIMLLIFCIIAYNSITNIKYFPIILGITAFSIIFSFSIMCIKNKYKNERIAKTKTKGLKINPLVKSTTYDYFNSDFFAMAIVCITVSLIIIATFIMNTNMIYNWEIYYIIITVVFIIGFMGIIESIPNINWKFQAIISPNDFKYHIKRTMFFLGGVYGWALLLFIIIGSIINLALLIKYLYCLIALLLVTVHVAFMFTNKIKKIILMMSIITITIWLSTLSAWFLPILIIPIILTLFKAKNEYREWSTI